jgi:hypothetical protein
MQVFLTYLDATSMYAGIMRKKLPLGDIKSILDEKEKFEKLSDMEYLKTIDCDEYIGYAYLVDYYTPDELHDYLNDLPIACEKRTVTIDELSSDQINIRLGFGEKESLI